MNKVLWDLWGWANSPMAGMTLTIFRLAVACRMFSGNSSQLKATWKNDVSAEQSVSQDESLPWYSHVDDQQRVPPVAVFEEVQEVVRVGRGDVQGVHHVEEGLEPREGTAWEVEAQIRPVWFSVQGGTMMLVTREYDATAALWPNK